MGMNVNPYLLTLPEVTGYATDAKEIAGLGITKLRMGGTFPRFLLQANFAIATTSIAIYKQYIPYVEFGCSDDTTFTSSNWADYHDYAVLLAQSAIPAGADAFMVGNELTHFDGTTITQDIHYSNIVQLAADIHALFPSTKIVYNGTANEMDLWTTWIGIHGALPSYFQLGFNLYGSGQTDTSTIQTQISKVQSLNGYISEWTIYYQWDTGVTFDQTMQKTYMDTRFAIVDASGLDHYFFVWKFQNPNVPGNWNDYGLKYSHGIPTNPGTSWGTRKFFKSLFVTREELPNTTVRSLSFDGSASYATYPVLPSGAGISLAFWYNRQSYPTTEKYIIGNQNPANGYKSGFRLYHEAVGVLGIENRRIVFSTYDDDSSQNFRVVTSLTGGVWVHIAITIVPGSDTAILYINGVPQAGIPGYIGSPTDLIVIGARAGDNALKNKMNIWNLAIKNTSTPWTQQQILDHKNLGTIPTGASWFNFTSGITDQSGSGNDLTVSGTSFVNDAPYLTQYPTRTQSYTRPAFHSRSAV